MFGLIPTTLGLTVALTAAAFLVTAFRLGPAFVLVLAMLGEAAYWLVALHLTVALPAAVFGGAMLSGSGPRTSDTRPQPLQVATLTLVATLISIYLVGWVAPAGFRASGEAFGRYNETARATNQASPAALEFPALLADNSPVARGELGRRVRLIAPCLVLGLLATILIAAPFSWSTSVAFGGTALAFLWQARQFVAGVQP